jgi:hypothetical protein
MEESAKIRNEERSLLTEKYEENLLEQSSQEKKTDQERNKIHMDWACNIRRYRTTSQNR